ncbi:MAG: carboxypeptidase regulatory-like domain-containing protein [Saprospiraceae bacterium]|nr:carboxypeptidase regulatory-like domain-containing protein [Saprospiraceae bacterium]
MKVLFFTLCAGILILLPSGMVSRKHVMTGKVMYDKVNAAPDVSITILNAADKSILNSAISDSEGNFEFRQLKPGKYFIAAGTYGNPLKVIGPIEVKDSERRTVVQPIIVDKPKSSDGPVIKTTRVHTVKDNTLKIS